MKDNNLKKEVETTINKLIQAGTSFNINQLELLYHKDLDVTMVNDNGDIMKANKDAFKNLFQSKLDNNEPPLNTWAEFNLIEAEANKAHAIVTRKVKLTDEEQKLTLSIDLIFEEQRWQVVREVIFAQPLN
ncbi:hypothetical protein [uncultured Algibacter sp.]|uniref:hypothetical protein n=1 Tax=uncultured Algibacter sp. TaxID=298659 RepID=UPI0032178556